MRNEIYKKTIISNKKFVCFFSHLYQLNQIDQNNDRLYIQINHMILLNYRQLDDQNQLNS